MTSLRFSSTAQGILCLLVLFVLLVGCSASVTPAALPVVTPRGVQLAAPSPTPIGRLDVSVLYPCEDSELEMGQATKFTAQVGDTRGNAVSDAQVVVTVLDPQGNSIATLPASHGGQGVYRTDYWAVPHRMPEGTWRTLVDAQTAHAQGNGSGDFQVKSATSEILLAKYGFWLDAPHLRDCRTWIAAEAGDARDGMVSWGSGATGAAVMHFQFSAYVDVHWRAGNYQLDGSAAVRRFLVEQIGDMGLMSVRSIGLIQPMRFKHWDAWRVECLTTKPEEMEWVVFYAPEMGKTYAIATTVELPPAGSNPHAALRESFAVFPDVHAAGIAPVPLRRLLPGPELISPPLAARFRGLDRPIVLQWKPVRELAEDEYYEVEVDYYYREAHPIVEFATRQTQVTLPETLYRTPNCNVFNWRVTLKRQIGLMDDGRPKGEPVSYMSLYRYFWWQYPVGEQPFPPACPYTHRD